MTLRRALMELDLQSLPGWLDRAVGSPHALRHGRHAVYGHKALGKIKMTEMLRRSDALRTSQIFFTMCTQGGRLALGT